ncbi:MAG: hypothetical protein DRP45_01480, partial [Candidatus Zixiibacteriota bacterium]
MHLNRLEIKNFRVIRRTRIEFTDRLTGIIGPNGAGKSSLVEAVAWALYGNPAARSGKEEIRSAFAGTSGTCEVALEFAIGTDNYRIERRLIGKTDRTEVSLFRSGAIESVGSTETQRHVVSLLGLDWRGFLTSFLARQQELNALADLRPAERREHLAGMLGIRRLDQAIQRAKTDSRVLSSKGDVLQNQADQKEAIVTRTEELQEHIGKIRQLAEMAAGAYTCAREKFRSTEVSYREHQEKQAKCSQIDAQVKAMSTTREHILQRLGNLHEREKQLLEAQQRLAILEPLLVELDVLRETLGDLKAAEQKARHRTELEGQQVVSRRELSKLKTDVSSIQAELDQVEGTIRKIPEDITDQHSTAETALERTREEWVDYQSELKTNRSEASRLRVQIEEIGNIGPDAVCDRCHRPFGDDLPRIREHLNAELKTYVKAGEELMESLEVRQAEGEKLKTRVKELALQAQQNRELLIRRKSLVSRLEE